MAKAEKMHSKATGQKLLDTHHLQPQFWGEVRQTGIESR